MARKRHSDEDVLKLRRELELKLVAGGDLTSACRSVGINNAAYNTWRNRFCDMRRSQLSEITRVGKENAPLKKMVARLDISDMPPE